MQQPPAGPVTSRARRVAALSLAVVVAVALLSAVPGVLGLAAWTPLAQLIAFRVGLALGLLAAAAALLAVPRALRRLVGARGGGSRARTAAAAGLALAAAVHIGVLSARGASAPGPTATRDEQQDGDLVVLSLNTEHGAASAEQVAAAVEAGGADVVVLPETPEAAAQQVAAALNRPFSAHTTSTDPAPTHSTSLLLADELGPAVLAPAPEVALGAVAATPASLPGPVVAVHPMAPVPGTGQVPVWRDDVPRAAAACGSTRGAVVAGDFNATLDHPGLLDLGPCVDAADEVSAAALGTWPARVPSLLGAPIDHVLVDARTWRVVSVRVVVVGATDHRGLLVHLARRA